MLAYRRVQPKVKALCAKYGVPYVQEGVFTRFRKMLAVAVGDRVMPRGKTTRAASARSAAGPLEADLEPAPC